MLRECAAMLVAVKVPMPKGVKILICVLKLQLAALEAPHVT